MSMERCFKCACPSTLVDTDYHCEIYRVGFSMYPLAYTGKPKDYCALCDECADGLHTEHYTEHFERMGIL